MECLCAIDPSFSRAGLVLQKGKDIYIHHMGEPTSGPEFIDTVRDSDSRVENILFWIRNLTDGNLQHIAIEGSFPNAQFSSGMYLLEGLLAHCALIEIPFVWLSHPSWLPDVINLPKRFKRTKKDSVELAEKLLPILEQSGYVVHLSPSGKGKARKSIVHDEADAVLLFFYMYSIVGEDSLLRNNLLDKCATLTGEKLKLLYGGLGMATDALKDVLKKFEPPIETPRIPTGSVIFDAVLGGGMPLGCYVEIASAPGLGKSTAVLHFCRMACSLGKRVVYMDFEQALNDSQINGIGLKDYREKGLFVWKQPVTYEDAEEILKFYKDDPLLTYICIDSSTAMLPGKLLEDDKSVGDLDPGLQARMAALFLLKYKAWARQRSVTFLLINQVRTKLNFTGRTKTEAAGGNAQKHYADIRLTMTLSKKIEQMRETLDGKISVPYGAHVEIEAEKNKYAPPYIPVICTVLYGKGLSNFFAYKRWLERKGFLSLKGAWYYLNLNGKEEKAQGEAGVINLIRNNSAEVLALINSAGGFVLVQELEG